MSTPANYTEIAREILNRLDKWEPIIMKLARQVDTMYQDDDYQDNVTTVIQDNEDMPMEERIKKYGQKVPYNLIDDTMEVMKFREFLYEAKKKGSTLNQFERDMLDIADKNFDDIRLSSKHLNILKSIHEKIMGRKWMLKCKQGYMYKLEGFNPEWEWFP
jgi:hypothetical protein